MVIFDDKRSDEWRQAESGLYLPSDLEREEARPLAIDLFSGCGGMSLGLIQAGFDIIAALEWDPAAIHTYLSNLGAYPVKMIFSDDEAEARTTWYFEKYFKKVFKDEAAHFSDLLSGSNRDKVLPDYSGVRFMFVGDARKFTGRRMLDEMGLRPGDVALVAGGPPCQGFTTANAKRNRMDPRNSLVFEFARLVLEIQPKTMMMENVPGILNMVTPEGVPVVDALMKIISDGGFGEYDALRKSLLESSGCGAAIRGRAKAKEVWQLEAQGDLF